MIGVDDLLHLPRIRQIHILRADTFMFDTTARKLGCDIIAKLPCHACN